MTSSTFHNLLGYASTTLTATNSPHSSTKAVDLTNGITSIKALATIQAPNREGSFCKKKSLYELSSISDA